LLAKSQQDILQEWVKSEQQEEENEKEIEMRYYAVKCKQHLDRHRSTPKEPFHPHNIQRERKFA
jgi:hypothetical protein